MLDTTANAAAVLPQQDTGHTTDFAPTPSGCRQIGPRWYVLASYPKAERTAHAALHLKGFEPYLPLLTVRRPDRSYRTTALFPGYLFVRLDLARPWYPIRWCPGVFSLIALEGTPTPCPEAAVDTLRASEHLRATPQPPSALWAPGMACRLAVGTPFQGHDAVLTEVEDDTARVALLMFGHLREIAVPLDCLSPRGDT